MVKMYKLVVNEDEARWYDIRFTDKDVAVKAVKEAMRQMSQNGYQELDCLEYCEPSCGSGVFIDSLLDYDRWIHVEGYELSKTICQWLGEKYDSRHRVDISNEDFLLTSTDEKYDVIIGSPPKHLITQFINHALKKLYSNSSILCFVLPIDVDTSKWRVVKEFTNVSDKSKTTLFST